MVVFKPYLKIFLAVCLVGVLLSCDKKKENVVYEKTISSGKLDATFAWLDKRDNYHKDNYMPVFYKYYAKTLKDGNIAKAAHILEVVCSKKARNYSFDDKFVNTINTFVNTYQAQLPVEKTVFVNSYFSTLYRDKGDFKKAISYALKTTLIPVKDYDTCLEVAYAFTDLSYCYFSIGNQNLAIEYNMEALHYFNQIQNINGIGAVYNSLAAIYFSSSNYEQAEKYYNKAIACFKEAKDLDNVFIALINKSIVYEDSKNEKLNELVDSTFNYFNTSGLESPDTKVMIYTCQISSLLRQNKLVEAKKIIDVIEPIVKGIDGKKSNIEFDVIIADYKIRNKEKIDSEKLLKEVIPYLIENENYQRLQIFYILLKENALKNNDYKAALHYEEKKTEALINLGNENDSNKVIELDKKYQNEKKEQQIATQEKIIAKKNATIAWMAFAILIVIVVIVIYQSKQKQKKSELDKQSAQNYTKQLLEKTEEERKRIASDLHDSVSHDLLALKNLFEDKASGTNAKIDAIINDIRIISRNLHPVMFDKIGLKESILQMVERAQSVNNFMLTAEIEYQSNLGSLAELQIYRIVQESVSNIIKYAHAVAAKITISEVNDKIYIEIKDNGKGFDVEATLANDAAFGLHNIIERSRAIGGRAKIVSDNKGTVITIEINT